MAYTQVSYKYSCIEGIYFSEVWSVLSWYIPCITWQASVADVQYIPRNMHTVSALLCFVVVIHWLIFPYPSGLLHWHCGNLTIAPVPAKQPWWIWINTSCEFIMNDCITTTKQSTTKPCAYFLGYTVNPWAIDICKHATNHVESHLSGPGEYVVSDPVSHSTTDLSVRYEFFSCTLHENTIV